MTWVKKRIKDFTNVITGGTPSTGIADYWDCGDIPWLNSGELNQGIITECSNYITRKGLNNSSAKLMPADSVLVALTGATTGVTGYLTFEACANQSVTGVLPSDYHNPKYLYYYLSSIRPKIINDAYGGAQKHISQQYIKEIEVPLPPLPIQQQIADTLDKADALRRKDQELLDKYDELGQSVFYEMFGDPVRNEKGWDIFRIRDICNFSQGVQISLENQHFECTSVMKRFLRISDYTQLVEPRYVINDDKKAWVEKDDIVMVRYGASAGYIGFGLEGVLANNLFKFNIDKKRITPFYLLYFLNTEYFQSFIKRVAFGAAMPALSFRLFDDVNIPVPDIKTQIAFSSRVKNIINQKNLCKSTMDVSLSFFNSELSKYFN